MLWVVVGWWVVFGWCLGGAGVLLTVLAVGSREAAETDAGVGVKLGGAAAPMGAGVLGARVVLEHTYVTRVLSILRPQDGHPHQGDLGWRSQETGWRRQETGWRSQETGWRRQETGWRRQEHEQLASVQSDTQFIFVLQIWNTLPEQVSSWCRWCAPCLTAPPIGTGATAHPGGLRQLTA